MLAAAHATLHIITIIIIIQLLRPHLLSLASQIAMPLHHIITYS